ncbi:MAG: isoprenylcysteine carboxylmethyltransferase family protein [Lewinellaceae bacterium]|nr:isoprenylcysteine carboxylmethyltransferase family protein [Lewinellaceae bacterium]
MIWHPLTVFLSWLAYFALHSLLAAGAVKKWTEKNAPVLYRYYRLIYNVVATGLLIWLSLWLVRSEQVLLFEPPLWLRVISGGVAATGLWLVGASLYGYDLGEFLGIRSATAPDDTLRVSGLNARVRHPLYLGILLAVAGGWLLWPGIDVSAVAAATLCYLPAGIYWEEQKLLLYFGDAYREYRRRVKRLIPGVW